MRHPPLHRPQYPHPSNSGVPCLSILSSASDEMWTFSAVSTIGVSPPGPAWPESPKSRCSRSIAAAAFLGLGFFGSVVRNLGEDNRYNTGIKQIPMWSDQPTLLWTLDQERQRRWIRRRATPARIQWTRASSTRGWG